MPGLREYIVVPVLAALAVAAGPVSAQERYRRDWSDYPGMPQNIRDLTYDDRGFLWLAGEEGLHRFDGQQVVPWGSRPGDTVVGINRGPAAQMVAFTERGKLFEVSADGLTPVDDIPFERVWGADYDGAGALWVADTSGLFRRDTAGGWARVEPPELVGREPMRVRGAAGGGAYVGTNPGDFIRVHADLSAERWFSDPGGQITRIAVKDERTQAFALRFGEHQGIYLVEDGTVRLVYKRKNDFAKRWTGLVFRDETLWGASTESIVAVSDHGARIQEFGPQEGFEPGGEVVVDHEKSLWLTSFRGIYQFTEPDVILWKNTEGTRHVHAVGTDIVLGRWEGPRRKPLDGDWESMTPAGYHIFDWGGVSPWGSTWFVAVKAPNTPQNSSALLEIDRNGFKQWLADDFGAFAAAYATDETGVFWIAVFDTLWRVDRRGAAPRAVATLPTQLPDIRGLYVEGRHVRMAHRYGPYCEGDLDVGRSALDGEWDCQTIEGAGELLDFKLVDGESWLATWERGVLRRKGDAWETVLGADELGAATVRGINLSPSGGVWVVTYLERVRIELQEGHARIVERLGPWIGVPAGMNFGAFEQPDGSIWLSGFSSAIEIPGHARQRPTDPPRVFVTGFRADGRDLSPEKPQTLPATTRRIDLSWAAPAYRDPASIRFQVRADSDVEWVPTTQRSFRFVDLGPGNYRIEVRASLDGETWSGSPADIRFSIRSPLWQRPTFWAAMLALGAIGLLSAQWLRTRQQVRLERQRTEIAMNLHDELGAGLGSIGLLTDLASDETMDAGERREVALRVGEISRDLSRSLSDIVWTLRPASVDLPGFALFLRQRASDLLSGGDIRIEFVFPDPVPPVRVELAVRQQIHAIASEALYNAAKHAGASKVRVELRQEGDGWVLGIADDGVGLDDGGEPTGLGLESMRRRATSIGATLSIGVGDAGGCRVELRFKPRAEEQG